MDLTKLKDPFPAVDIEWRIGRCGQKNNEVWAMALAYITARAIHDRLDEVCGQENWQLRYVEHLGETVCEIGIKYGQEWIWKAGGAGKTEFEAFKGGLSSAEKRAGVPWGIGRYLYGLTETFVKCSTQKQNGWNYQTKNDKKGIPAFWWETPILPAWALPEGHKENPANKEQPKQDTPKPVDVLKPSNGEPMIEAQRKAITNLLGKEGMDEIQIKDFFDTLNPDFAMAADIIQRASVYAKEYLT